MRTYYNEFAPYPARWLRNLVDQGHLPGEKVDERSIRDIRPEELEGYDRCHFFAGIGGWELALRLAGWPEEWPVWTGSCPCFPAGTMVMTRRGHKPIEKVRVGDEVLTHRSRWRPVTAIGSNDADLVAVRGQGHWGLVTTANHPFLTGKDEWTNASDLVGKRWRTVAQVPEGAIPPIENNRGVMLERGSWRSVGWKDGHVVYLGRFGSEAEARQRRADAMRLGEINVRGADGADPTTIGFARFLGYWVGDGWTSGNNVFLCGAKGDADLLKSIMDGAKLSCSTSMERTSARARCGSKCLANWLAEHFGSGASSKRIPVWLHGAPADYREAFLAGYAEADGHTEWTERCWTTTSRSLAIGTRILLNQQGISASIGWKSVKASKVNGRPIPPSGFFRVTGYASTQSFTFSKEHGIGYVRSVKPAGRGKVYNLSVAEDETYAADGIVVHNCQPFSQIGKRKGAADERHLWPIWRELIAERCPPRIFGEQVASADGRKWLAGVRSDLEGMGYRLGAADMCAAGVTAPHSRQRLWWVAERAGDLECRRTKESGGMGDPDNPRPQGLSGDGKDLEQRKDTPRPASQASLSSNWDTYDLVEFHVGPQRRCPPGTHPVAYGIPAYMGMFAAYGNAIVPQVGATFIAAYMETIGCSR